MILVLLLLRLTAVSPECLPYAIAELTISWLVRAWGKCSILQSYRVRGWLRCDSGLDVRSGDCSLSGSTKVGSSRPKRVTACARLQRYVG
jgi:hypothetical protein